MVTINLLRQYGLTHTLDMYVRLMKTYARKEFVKNIFSFLTQITFCILITNPTPLYGIIYALWSTSFVVIYQRRMYIRTLVSRLERWFIMRRSAVKSGDKLNFFTSVGQLLTNDVHLHLHIYHNRANRDS